MAPDRAISGKESAYMASNSTKRPSKRRIKAMAYAIADIVETRALELMASDSGLSRESAMLKAIAHMARR